MKPLCICILIGSVIGGAVLAFLMMNGSELLKAVVEGNPDIRHNATEKQHQTINVTEWSSQYRISNSSNVSSVDILEAQNHHLQETKEAGFTDNRVVRGLEIAGLSIVIGIAVGTSVCLLGALITCTCLACMGYQKPGVATNSFASQMQRNIGNVKGGCCFTCCQSCGAQGPTHSFRTILITAVVAAVLASVISLLFMIFKK